MEGPLQAFQDKRHFERLVEFPSHHISAEPVEDRNQIKPSSGKSDIGDVDPPDMVRMPGSDSPEKIGINRVGQSPFTKIWPGMNPFGPHLAHRGPDPIPAHEHSVFLKLNRNPSAPVIGVGGIDLVDPVSKPNLFRRGRHGFVVKDRSGHPAEIRLDHHRQIGIIG